MGLAVVPFDQTDGPLAQVDGRDLGRLDEGVGILARWVSICLCSMYTRMDSREVVLVVLC